MRKQYTIDNYDEYLDKFFSSDDKYESLSKDVISGNNLTVDLEEDDCGLVNGYGETYITVDDAANPTQYVHILRDDDGRNELAFYSFSKDGLREAFNNLCRTGTGEGWVQVIDQLRNYEVKGDKMQG